MNLKEKRLQLGKTQLDIAKSVGVTEQTYRQWERGAMNPNEENQKKLDVIFNSNEVN